MVPIHVMSGAKPMRAVYTNKWFLKSTSMLLSAVVSWIRTIHEVLDVIKRRAGDEIIVSFKDLRCCESANVIVRKDFGAILVSAPNSTYVRDLKSRSRERLLGARGA